MLFVFHPNIFRSFSWDHFHFREKPKTILMQNFGVIKKEHYGMLGYFLESSIGTLYKGGNLKLTMIPLNPKFVTASSQFH